MKPSTFFFVLALLTACGVTRNQVVGSYPDGSIAQLIDCRHDHPEKCQQRSQQRCHPFGREPEIMQPLTYNQVRERWEMVIKCGPIGPSSPVASGPPAGSMAPLAPSPPTGSTMPQ